jgi:hypothetical protein
MSGGDRGVLSMKGMVRGKDKIDVPGDSSGSSPAMQRSKGEMSGKELVVHGSWRSESMGKEEEVLEFHLDEEVEQCEVKFLAMAHYYSGKKFNVWGLFGELKVAWGQIMMKQVKVLDDNKFLLEYSSDEERS